MIIYLHGLASVGKGYKSSALQTEFGVAHVAFPNLPVDPVEVEKIVDSIIMANKDYPVIFIGTSLGGFWAHYFSCKWDAPCVLVNPSITPSVSLNRYLPPAVLNNYVTAKPVTITKEMLDGYKVRENFIKSNSSSTLITLYGADDDSVLPFSKAKNSIVAGKIVEKETGGHRFISHWPEVVQRVRDITILLKNSTLKTNK